MNETVLFNQCEDHQIPNIVTAVFTILIVIVGLFGNAVVFFVIIVLKEYKKSVSNWYVLQLALADTLFLLMMPFAASNDLAGKWEFSVALCKAKEGIFFVNYYASIFFLTIMSFDRFMAVTQSGVSRWTDALRRIDSAALISLLAWIISICFCVPIFLYSKVNSCSLCSYDFPRTYPERCELMKMEWNMTSMECQEQKNMTDIVSDDDSNYDDDHHFDYSDISQIDLEGIFGNRSNLELMIQTVGNLSDGDYCRDTANNSYTTWLYVNFALMLVLPLLLICTFYGLILRTMMRTASTASTSQRQYRRRVTLMVLALVTLFAISWVPWYAVKLSMIQSFKMSKTGCGQLQDFTRILTYLNSALNPYFYSFMGSRFHQRFLRARSTATRKSRLFSYLSRMSWRPGHDSNNSTSGGGTGKLSRSGHDMKMRNMNGFSDDDSFNTKTNLRTERTLADAQ